MNRKKRKQKAHKVKEQTVNPTSPMRRMTQGLIFSGALNIALATSLIYYAVKDKDSSPSSHSYVESQVAHAAVPSGEFQLQYLLEDYSHLDFESLVQLLKDSREVQQGFSQRELALSTLVHFHDFDLSRAISRQNYDVQYLSLNSSSNESVPIFKNLGDSAYKHILSFLKVEQWPYTSEGLYKRIAQGHSDESLKKAFYLTKEFMLLEALYAPVGVGKEKLLELVQQGPWTIVKEFVDSKPLVQNFSNPLRIRFLCQYLDYASSVAAESILNIDPEYALHKLTDDKAVSLIGLLENRTPLNENFVLHLALGSRSQWVRQEACRLLYYYSQKEFKEPFNYQEALDFIAHEYDLSPQSVLNESTFESQNTDFIAAAPIHTASAITTYVVQKGDCLSKIAKMHKVDVKKLKAANQLDEDLIRVGMTLIIP